MNGRVSVFLRNSYKIIISFKAAHKDFKSAEEQERLSSEMAIMLSTIPECYYETLKYVLGHLNRVSMNSAENLMTCQNLAVVFGSNLMRSAPSENSVALLQFSELNDLGLKNLLAEFLIRNFNLIFSRIE